MAYKTNWKLYAEYIDEDNKELTHKDKERIENYIFDNEYMDWVFGEV